jgi:hypothetical protein
MRDFILRELFCDWAFVDDGGMIERDWDARMGVGLPSPRCHQRGYVENREDGAVRV